MLLWGAAAEAKTLDDPLRWTISPSSDVEGYLVHVGQTSGFRASGGGVSIDIGNDFDLIGTTGHRRLGDFMTESSYVVMQAYGSSGQPSVDSNEIHVTIDECVVDSDCGDADLCNGNESCVAGSCVAGTPPVCSSGGQCSTAQCDASLGCVEVAVANGTACNDGNACTIDDSCEAGLCAPGGAQSCSDPGPCRSGYCDPQRGCTSDLLADGTVCSDGDPATLNDSCQVGVCVGSEPEPECVVDGDCRDADLCNGNESCVAGSCVAGTPPACSSSGQCSTAQCDASLGCVEVAVANGTACSDGNACTIDDSCQVGVCAPGGAQSCSDPGPCRSGYCDPQRGCTSDLLADGTVCSDGDPATLNDSCQVGVCVGSEPEPECVVDGDCRDANLCNGNESCVAGSCVAGTPPACSSSGQCSTAQCDASLGCVEVAVADGTACSDGNACTVDDSCEAGLCGPGGAQSCSDPGPCRSGYCDPQRGCTSDLLADGTVCSDGDPVTLDDSCQVGICVGSEPEPNPGPPGSTRRGIAKGKAGLQNAGHGLDDSVRAASPDGDPRLFAVQRDGRIYVAEAGQVLTKRAFLDLRSEVSDVGDGGLLGLAFDPDYASNGYFYVYRTVRSGDAVLSRFQVSGDAYVANRLSEFEILRIALPTPGSNPGGGLAFDLDGYLLVGVGDGDTLGDPGDRAQDGDQLLGKILRLDISDPPSAGGYRIPHDNPFLGAGNVRDEIWALGLRNPSHLAVDSTTGDLWITDQGQSTRLEINFEPGSDAGGHNYGWDVMEGTACNTDRPATNISCGSAALTEPIFEYDLTSASCEIVGGYVYRGALPDLSGQFFFADACAGSAWSYDREDDTLANRSQQFDDFVSGNVHVVGFGQDGFGEGYVLTSDGRLYKMRGTEPECSDGVDNDGDGLVDDGADPGCANAESVIENPRCDDYFDNDGDGQMDAADAQCTSRAANVEAEAEPGTSDMLTEETLCGLGAELALIFPPLMWLRNHRRRARRG